VSKLFETLQRLAATIETRKGGDPSASYTAKLLGEGPERTAKKFGEEAIETAIAAVQGDADHVAAESADLIYHWLVLLSSVNVSLDEVAAKLEAREGTSGIAEKAGRKAH
jgi:phosphoribosyl-ATP pyrophosphohydrolase